MDDSFVNLGEYKAGCARRLFLKKKKWVNSNFAMTIWRFWVSECKYVLLLVKIFAIDTHRVCVCEGNRVTSQRSVQPVRNHSTSAFLTAACVLQIHTSIITVSVTRLCSTFGLELMVKLTTLLTVFIFTLKAEARDYGKGRYISDASLWCSASHNALCQLANQQTALVGKRGFVENDALERGGA